MKVSEVMTPEPQSCAFDTNLAQATELLWSNDCGVLPVVEDGKLAGIITDRDICIALGTRRRFAEQTPVRDVATRDVQTCSSEDDVHAAMAVMRRARVRRLPVVDREGKLEGILALNDIVLAVDLNQHSITHEELLNTIKAVSEHTGENPLAVPKGPAPAGLESQPKSTGKAKTVGGKG